MVYWSCLCLDFSGFHFITNMPEMLKNYAVLFFQYIYICKYIINTYNTFYFLHRFERLITVNRFGNSKITKLFIKLLHNYCVD